MKPLVIRVQAFGPYKGEEIIDFQKLSEQGIFLICGETGSGKTTILDAMTFALYGKSSGGMRDQLEAMRCRQSEWGTDTYVVYDFLLHGKVYRFERKLECKKVKLSASQNVYLQNEEGVFEPLFENCKEKDITGKTKELLGLDYEQFRQVIILPQGQFEKLLTSNSDEKEKILVSIFGVNKWQKIAGHFYEAAAKERNKLLEVKEEIRMRLQDERCADSAEFSAKIEALHEEILQKQERFEKLDYEGSRKKLEAEKELAKQFAAMHDLQRQIQAYEEKEAEYAKQNQILELAEQAQGISVSLQAFEEAKQNVQRRSQEERTLFLEMQASSEREKICKDQLDVHMGGKKEVELIREAVIRLEDKRSSYEGLQQLEKALKAEEIAYEQAEVVVKAAVGASEKAQEKLLLLSEAYKKVREEHRVLSECFLAGITGVLASKLQVGEPCPVCGNLEHPKKAPMPKKAVTEKEVKQKEQEMHQKFQEIEYGQREQEEALRQKESKERACAEQKNKVMLAQKALQDARASLEDGIETLRDLEQLIDQKKKQIQEFQNRQKKLEEAWKKETDMGSVLKGRLEHAKAEAILTQEEMKKAKILLEKALQKTVFKDFEQAKSAFMPQGKMQQIRRDYVEYQAQRKHLASQFEKIQKELQGKAEPDLEACNFALQQLENTREVYISEHARLQELYRQKQEKIDRLKQMEEKYAAAWTQAETDWTIAKNLRGDTGIGLQRYVLGVMFSSVIAAANKMLEKVHGGRYRLFRSDEKGQGSNKKGLELKVFDSFSKEGDEGRSVKTLSGGEKFLVSLALSIGMSTIAQRSGTHLDAMFVDEGFGSLDQNSIEDALGILAGIQKANGTVGIISHVQVLQDNIPTKLEVKKSREGSRIVMNIG